MKSVSYSKQIRMLDHSSYRDVFRLDHVDPDRSPQLPFFDTNCSHFSGREVSEQTR